MSPSSVVSDVLERLRAERVLEPTKEELESVLAGAEFREERDTGMAGPIRLLRIKDEWLVQEFTDRGEPRLRRFGNESEARAFIEERLRTYDRMWDGCGCRIDYDN